MCSVAGGVNRRLNTWAAIMTASSTAAFAYPDEQVSNTRSLRGQEWGRGHRIWSTCWPWMRMEEGELVPVLLEHSAEAAESYMAWDRMNTDRINEANAAGNELSAASSASWIHTSIGWPWCWNAPAVALERRGNEVGDAMEVRCW